MGKKQLTDQEGRMASAWVDQELPEAERDYVESRLVEGDSSLREEIESYRTIRNEFRSWFQKEIEPESRKIDVWRAVEKELLRKPGIDWRALRAKFFEAFSRPVAVGGFAGALALALLVFSRSPFLSGNSAPLSGNSSGQLASGRMPGLGEEEAIEIATMQDQAGLPGAPTLVSTVSDPDLLARLPVPDSLTSRLLISPQLIVGSQLRDGQIPGGFRSGNTDIEWIKTNKPFKLVTSRQRQTPPVIWVARASR